MFSTSSTSNSSKIHHAYSESGLDIYHLYQQYLKPYLNEKKYLSCLELPDKFHGSICLRKFAWKSNVNSRHFALNKDTSRLVNTIWNDAVGNLSDLFTITEDDLFAKLTLDMIDKSEIVLQKQREEFEKGKELPIDYSDEFYKSLPFKENAPQRKITDKRNLSLKFEMCQMMRDVVSINEATDWNRSPSNYSKYRYMRNLILKHKILKNFGGDLK